MRTAALLIAALASSACFNSGGADAQDAGTSPDAGALEETDAAADTDAAAVDPDAGPATVESACTATCATLVGCSGGELSGCLAACGDALADCEPAELEAVEACAGASCDEVWDECISLVGCVDDDGEPTCGDGSCDVGECAACEEDCPDGCGCTHDVCSAGAPLDPGCGECEAIACSLDEYCCTVEWDGICVDLAAAECGTCGGCGDGVCDAGECDDCAADCPGGCGQCSDGTPAFGADAFGYLGCASTLGDVPPCEDLSATGTPGCNNDDCASTVTLPFAFDFHGVAHTQVSFISNGTLAFPGSLDYDNSCSVESDTIAVYWDDLDAGAGGSMYHRAFGTAPDRHVTFQWKVPHFDGGSLYDIRAVLREGSSDIEVCYVDTVTLDEGTDEGASATVGIAGPTGDHLDYSCYQPVVSSGLLLRYEHPGGGGGGGGLASAIDSSANFNPRSVAIADLDGDGLSDLAVANQNTNQVSILLGHGDGSYQAPVGYPTGGDAYSVAIGDLDADGAPDLAVANLPNTGSISVLLGVGDGTFEAAVDLAAGENPHSVAIADVNADGDLDLLAANMTSDDLSVLLGNGDGTFAAAVEYPAGDGAFIVAIGDVDADDVLDAVVADLGAGVSVLLGNGDGTFQAPLAYAAGAQPRSVAIGDLDGDGAPDLAVASFDGDDLSILLGNGDGTFQPAVAYPTGNDPHAVAIADLDGDGSADVAVANVNDAFASPGNPGSLSVFAGNGDGTLDAAVSHVTGSGSIAVAIGNVNGDSMLDVVVANYGSHDVSVLLGL